MGSRGCNNLLLKEARFSLFLSLPSVPRALSLFGSHHVKALGNKPEFQFKFQNRDLPIKLPLAQANLASFTTIRK